MLTQLVFRVVLLLALCLPCVRVLAETSQVQAKTVATWQKKAAAGDVQAQYQLALYYEALYYDGRDYANLKKSLQYSRSAAKQGHARAQLLLGQYEIGRGADMDLAAARHWLLKAAEQGMADAQKALGDLYAEGAENADGTEKLDADSRQAAIWYQKAEQQYLKDVDAGDVDAQITLGNWYIQGRSISRDVQRGIKLCRALAEAGNARAQTCYGLGLGMSGQNQQAQEWLYKAIDNGSLIAPMWLDALKRGALRRMGAEAI